MRRLIGLACVGLLAACGHPADLAQYGPAPTLPDPQRQLLPTMNIANPTEWAGRKPVVPQGYIITAIATAANGWFCDPQTGKTVRLTPEAI